MDILKCILKIYPDWRGVVWENDYNRIILHELEVRQTPTLIELENQWLSIYKNDKCATIKEIASDYIFSLYPATTQHLINTQIGYVQQDKDTLWDFLQKIETRYNSLCDTVNACISTAEIDAVAINFTDITPEPTALPPAVSSTTASWFASLIKILTGIMVFVSMGIGYAEGVI